MNILEMCDAGGASVPMEATAEDAIRAMLDRHVGETARARCCGDRDALFDHRAAAPVVPLRLENDLTAGSGR